MKTGKVKWFNAQKGFGFIVFEGKDVFVHFKDVEGGASGIKDDDDVEFEIEQGKKGPQAVNVKRV